MHTFHAPESNEEFTDTFMMVNGANINFGADNKFMNIMDAGWIEQVVLAAVNEQGVTPRYIKPKASYNFSDK